MPASKKEILKFWFGDLSADEPVPSARPQLWFGGGDQTDSEIRRRFGGAVDRALAGGCAEWESTAEGSLALILLLDQFTRNIFRHSPRAYAGDGRALALCRRGCEQGQDRQLPVIPRAFFYLPLEHAEDLLTQRASVAAFTRLLAEAPPAQKVTCRGFLDYAVRHRDIIERFGRFPHRNAVLGRTSTPEETEFLKQPGSSF